MNLFREAIIDDSWISFWDEVLKKNYVESINTFLTNRDFLPARELIFNAFKMTCLNNLKVVIVGQDPYHGPSQAHGLSFSVPSGVSIPPSLRNIYKEVNHSLGLKLGEIGDLTAWAKQGVLLLNSVLSVDHGKPGSHSKIGWEMFTDHVLQHLNDNKSKLIFMLWGKYACSKGDFLNSKKHLILKSSHPSPFSAYRGFLGCDHFKKCNQYLKINQIKAINWKL